MADESTMRDHIEDLLTERAALYDLIRKYRARCAANNHQPMTGVMCAECYIAQRDVP